MVSPHVSSEFEIDLSDFATSYANLHTSIETELERLIKMEAPANSKGVRLFQKINGKLYTPLKAGTFLIRLKPTLDAPIAEWVTLL
ncbi:hypothetical protein ACP4OV_018239 [Aristida adscensionis]